MGNTNAQTPRVAFVTGGSGDIGAQICKRLVQLNYKVAVGYNSGNVDFCSDLPEAVAVKCNVLDYSSVKSAYNGIIKAFGRSPDTLINCAGLESYKLISDETEDSINKVVGVNLNGVIYTCNIFSPDMVSAKFGRIINISSVWGVCGAAMETVYSAAKAGVIGFTKALGSELAPSGITVNCISPGFIDTKMNARFTAQERNEILEEIPACRFGTPNDIVGVAEFLLSENSSYVTGQNIIVSGGYKNI